MSGLPYEEYRWHGAPEDVDAALTEMVPEAVIGPRLLDGIAYVAVRFSTVAVLPSGLEPTGPELSDWLIGHWMRHEEATEKAEEPQ